MSNKIFLAERVKNKDRKFGEATEYIPVLFVSDDGKESHGLLTNCDVDKALDRAARNPEDIPGKTLWELFFGKKVD